MTTDGHDERDGPGVQDEHDERLVTSWVEAALETWAEGGPIHVERRDNTITLYDDERRPIAHVGVFMAPDRP